MHDLSKQLYPAVSGIDRGEAIDTKGKVHLVKDVPDKVVKSQTLTRDLVIGLNRLNQESAGAIGVYNSVGNILIPHTSSHFRDSSSNQVSVDLVFSRMDGDVTRFISNPPLLPGNLQFSAQDLISFVSDSSTAMSLLDKLRLAHADLKLDNFLYKKEPGGETHFFLSDFGNLIAGSISENNISSDTDYQNCAFNDRNHYIYIINSLLTDSIFEQDGDKDKIISLYGQEMFTLIDSFKDSIILGGDAPNYQEFNIQFSSIIKSRYP